MNTSEVMSAEYLALAAERVAMQCAPHRQPEDFGYDFRTWVSPYTKGANKTGGPMLVLQDWSSADGLSGQPNPDIQLYGRTPKLLTNRRLEQLLGIVLGLRLCDVYATNVFPFVKAGGMSAALRKSEVRNAARQFAVREVKLARPTVVLALGVVAHSVLRECEVSCIGLPHPAARIGGIAKHETAWRAALASSDMTLVTSERA
jgi:uracil-DNA glycosylase